MLWKFVFAIVYDYEFVFVFLAHHLLQSLMGASGSLPWIRSSDTGEDDRDRHAPVSYSMHQNRSWIISSHQIMYNVCRFIKKILDPWKISCSCFSIVIRFNWKWLKKWLGNLYLEFGPPPVSFPPRCIIQLIKSKHLSFCIRKVKKILSAFLIINSSWSKEFSKAPGA